MDDSILQKLLTQDDFDVLRSYNADFGRKAQFGKQPAVLVIDFSKACVGVDAPIMESIKVWPKSAGSSAWSALRNASRIIDPARKSGVPIYYTIPVPLRSKSRVGFVPKTETEKAAHASVMDLISPCPEDRIIHKSYPSAFFGTNIMSRLNEDHVDTLIVTGGTTSGCIRATVVDGCSHHFQVVVAEDALYDRIRVSHEVNLFEMGMKYADIASTEEVIEYLSSIGDDELKVEALEKRTLRDISRQGGQR